METINNEIKGTTILAKFIRENLDEIVERKMNILNKDEGFLYVDEDGDYYEGRNSQYGQSSIADFGGKAVSRKQAINQLQKLIDLEPFEMDAYNGKLKKLLK